MELRARSQDVAGHRVLALDGAADLAALPDLHRLLGQLVDRPGAGPVAVDLDGVTVLDDASLGLLLGAAARARAAGVDFLIVCSAPALRRRLAETRLDQVIDVGSALVPAAVTPPGDDVS